MGKRKRTTSSKDTNEGPVKQSYNEDAGVLDTRKGRVLPSGKSSTEVSAEVGDLSLSSRIIPQRPEDQELLTQQLQVHGNTSSPTRTGPAPAASGAPPLTSSAPTTVTVRSQQLRTSARVQIKQQQRREENRHDVPTAGVQQPTKGQLEGAEESGGGGGGSGSGGGSTTTGGAGGGGEQLRRKRRPWELWSLEDKNLFFEALNECGKDFEGLQTYLATKLRKKGVPGYQIKNRDKVRHFYYRTWHKIAKYMKFYEDDRIFSGVKKATQELYGLINYGELRKKVGGTLDERKGQKLQELVLKGSTSVRIRGKSVRVKTPICRALKRVNQLEDNKDGGEVPRLPPCVQVELVPASGRAWRRVQELAFNPRVRLTCALHRTLASLVRHLQDKWRPPQLKLRDKLVSGANFAVTVPDVKEPRVRVRPPKDCVIARISVQPGELIRSSSVSLASHEARLVAASSSLRGVAATGSHQRGSGSGSTKDKGSTAATAASKRKRASKVVADASNRTEADYSSDDERPVILGGGPDVSAEGSGEVRSMRAGQVTVKDEPLDPPDSPLPSEQQDDQKLFQPLNPDLQIKEEEEERDISSRAVRELLALRTVARGPEEDQHNADVVCVGETTRLAALRLEGSTSSTSSAVASKVVPISADRGEASAAALVATADSDSEEREPMREQDVGTEVPGGVDQGSSTELAAEQEAQQKAQEEEQEMDRIRSGWTISSGIGITFGELYLRIGRNEKLCLEYEFEEVEDEEQDQQEEPISSCISPSTTTTTSTTATTSPTGPTSPSMGIFQTPPKLSRGADLQGAESEMRQAHIRAGLDAADTKGLIKGKELEAAESKEERRAAIENVSGMLCQLLVMARSLTTRPSCDKCPCGHVCGVRGGNLRSPATNRQLGVGGPGGVGTGRSPGGGRPMVGAAVGAGGARGSPSTARGSPSTTRVSKDRTKPNSAKQLLVVEGAAVSPGGKGVVTCGASPAAGSAGSTTAKELFAAVQPPSPAAHHPAVATSMPNSVGGVSVVVGASGGGTSATDPSGEFRVPLAPAPRQHTGTQSQQHQSFSAQLNKLLPRFNNRVGRRSVRKNVVVRQLPLLPKQSLPSSVVALKVVPQNRLTQGLTLNGGSAMALPPNTATILPQQQPATQQSPLPGGMMAKVTLPNLKENPPPGTNTVSVNIPNQPPLRVEISSANTFAVSPSPPAAVPTLVTPTSSIASSSAAPVGGVVPKVELGTWKSLNQAAPPTGKLVAAGTAAPSVELGVWTASNQAPPPTGTVPVAPKIELGTWTASNQVPPAAGKLVVAGTVPTNPKIELGTWTAPNQVPPAAGTVPQENVGSSRSVSGAPAAVVPNISCKLEAPPSPQDGSNSSDILHTLASQVFTDLPELRLVTSEFETSTARQTVSHKPQLAPPVAAVVSAGGAASSSPQTVEDTLPSLSSLLRSPSECGLTAATAMCLNTDGLLQTASSLELPQHKDALQNQSTNLTLASPATLLAPAPTMAFDGGGEGGGRRRGEGGGSGGGDGEITPQHLPCTSTNSLPPASAPMNTTTSPTTPLMSLLLQSTTEVAIPAASASSTSASLAGPTSSSPPQLATAISVSSASSVSPPGGAIPEFHIPESLMPMLDISLGGTISLADPSPPTPQTPNTPMPVHHNNHPVHHQEGSNAPSSASPSCPTTTTTSSSSTFSKFTASNTFLTSTPFNATTFSSTFSVTTAADSSTFNTTTTASGAFSATSFNTSTLHTSFNTTTTASSFSDTSFSMSSYPSSAVATSMSETSTDKLLDLALTNSNSNSSFTSLLAAAASLQPLQPSHTPQSSSAVAGGGRPPPPQPQPPLPSEDTTLDTPPRAAVAPGGSTSVVIPPPFPALSSTPPPPSSSPPSSPSRLLLLHHTDSQWLNNEVNDFSLSSFLGHLESPLKVLTTPGTGQASSPVASTATTTMAATGSVAGAMLPSLAHLTAVLNENSVDFTAKFAEMKAAASANTASAAFKP